MKRLSGSDAYMPYGENPNLAVHTLKIVVIDLSQDDRDFTFDRFRRIVQKRLLDLEPLRYRLVDIPLKLHHPMWLQNCDVDLEFHVRRVMVPSPGGRCEFDDTIARIAETPLELHRPLWEMYFAEGLADDKVAVIAKVVGRRRSGHGADTKIGAAAQRRAAAATCGRAAATQRPSIPGKPDRAELLRPPCWTSLD
jgi:hypothetical protein